MLELIGIHYSPYTERARWALEHHRISYRYREHLVLLGMPELRWKTGRLTGDVTVPALVGNGVKLAESFEIARYTDEHGTGSKLFPWGQLDDIRHYNALSEKALDAGRALMLRKIAQNPEAGLEQLPGFIPPALRKASAPIVKLGLNYIARSFNARAKSVDTHSAVFREVVSELRGKLQDSGGKYLLGAFSYADITMAMAVQFISPVGNNYIKLRPATRECWTDEALKKEFSDLVDWRDRLYEEHRKK